MEKIIDKLNKIRVLSERGEKNEAKAAKNRLDSLLNKYGLTLDDLVISDTVDYIISYHNKIQRELLIQIIVSHGLHPFRVTKGGKYVSKVAITVQPFLYAEIINEYSWHKRNFKKEMETLMRAYIHKHDLYPTDEFKSKHKPESKENVDAVKIALMLSSLNDEKFVRDQLYLNSR